MLLSNAVYNEGGGVGWGIGVGWKGWGGRGGVEGVGWKGWGGVLQLSCQTVTRPHLRVLLGCFFGVFLASVFQMFQMFQKRIVGVPKCSKSGIWVEPVFQMFQMFQRRRYGDSIKT